MTAQAPKPYHHGDLRRVLLDQAAQMIRQDGEAALSMRKLAAAVGVSRTAPYHHFADKQALLFAVAEEGFLRFSEMMAAATPGENTGVNEESLHRFIVSYLRFALDYSEYYDLMFGSHLWRDQTVSTRIKEVSHASFRHYVEQIRHWQSAGWVRPDIDPLRYAQVSWSTLHGMSRLLIDGIYVDLAAVEPMCRHAARQFWRELQVEQQD